MKKKYNLLIDNEDVSDEISQIIEFETIYTLWKGLCYRITQKIKVVEARLYRETVDASNEIPKNS